MDLMSRAEPLASRPNTESIGKAVPKAPLFLIDGYAVDRLAGDVH